MLFLSCLTLSTSSPHPASSSSSALLFPSRLIPSLPFPSNPIPSHPACSTSLNYPITLILPLSLCLSSSCHSPTASLPALLVHSPILPLSLCLSSSCHSPTASLPALHVLLCLPPCHLYRSRHKYTALILYRKRYFSKTAKIYFLAIISERFHHLCSVFTFNLPFLNDFAKNNQICPSPNLNRLPPLQPLPHNRGIPQNEQNRPNIHSMAGKGSQRADFRPQNERHCPPTHSVSSQTALSTLSCQPSPMATKSS